MIKIVFISDNMKHIYIYWWYMVNLSVLHIHVYYQFPTMLPFIFEIFLSTFCVSPTVHVMTPFIFSTCPLRSNKSDMKSDDKHLL